MYIYVWDIYTYIYKFKAIKVGCGLLLGVETGDWVIGCECVCVAGGGGRGGMNLALVLLHPSFLGYRHGQEIKLIP